jgi:hypothetical protein
MRTLQAVEMEVPINRVPTVRQSLNQGEIDFTEHPADDGRIKFTILCFDAYDMFEAGYAAAAESWYKSVMGPLGDLIKKMENAQKQSDEDKDSKLG